MGAAAVTRAAADGRRVGRSRSKSFSAVRLVLKGRKRRRGLLSRRDCKRGARGSKPEPLRVSRVARRVSVRADGARGRVSENPRRPPGKRLQRIAFGNQTISARRPPPRRPAPRRLTALRPCLAAGLPLSCAIIAWERSSPLRLAAHIYIKQNFAPLSTTFFWRPPVAHFPAFSPRPRAEGKCVVTAARRRL
jgi:hypothetical protein